MRGLKTWAWAAVIAATASPAFAQYSTGGTTTGTTGGTTGTTTGATRSTGSISGGTTAFGSGNTLGSSGLSSSGNGLGGSSSPGGTGANSTPQAPTITAPTGASSNSLQKSNFLAGYYVNPYSMGMGSTSASGGSATGSFGSALYGNTSTGAGGRGGATGAAGGGLGGQRGGQTNASNQSGILIALPVPISYTATMRFPTPPVAAPKLQADLRGIIDAGGISAPKSVQVIANGTDITLRGTVKDDEEARLVEGLVRLTPGVGNITNELTFPVAIK